MRGQESSSEVAEGSLRELVRLLAVQAPECRLTSFGSRRALNASCSETSVGLGKGREIPYSTPPPGSG
jgi:hypothetical protein